MPNWIELDRVKEQRKKIDIIAEKKKLGFSNSDKIVLFVHRLVERK
jgi:hypothetical protein